MKLTKKQFRELIREEALKQIKIMELEEKREEIKKQLNEMGYPVSERGNMEEEKEHEGSCEETHPDENHEEWAENNSMEIEECGEMYESEGDFEVSEKEVGDLLAISEGGTLNEIGFNIKGIIAKAINSLIGKMPSNIKTELQKLAQKYQDKSYKEIYSDLKSKVGGVLAEDEGDAPDTTKTKMEKTLVQLGVSGAVASFIALGIAGFAALEKVWILGKYSPSTIAIIALALLISSFISIMRGTKKEREKAEWERQQALKRIHGKQYVAPK